MPRRPSRPVGAHVFVAGGLARTGLRYARDIGAEAVQVFVSNPRGWASGPGDPRQDEAFRAGCEQAGMASYVHAPYLVNVASATPATLERSAAALRHALDRGRQIGAAGVVVHAGCATGGASYDAALAAVRRHLRPLVDRLTDADPDLLVELTAGGRTALCATPAAIPAYLDAVDRHPKVGICVDTCHAMAAGHDLRRPGAMRGFLTAVVRAAGPGRLRLVHANDSRDPVGSGRDRHTPVGTGSIGEAAFGEVFRHPATRGVPVLIETPGTPEEHARDIALLKRLRAGR